MDLDHHPSDAWEKDSQEQGLELHAGLMLGRHAFSTDTMAFTADKIWCMT